MPPCCLVVHQDPRPQHSDCLCVQRPKDFLILLETGALKIPPLVMATHLDTAGLNQLTGLTHVAEQNSTGAWKQIGDLPKVQQVNTFQSPVFSIQFSPSPRFTRSRSYT